MSINTDRDDVFILECDGCNITQEHDKNPEAMYGEDNGFSDMIASIKQEGWRIYKSDVTGEWAHFCPGCRDVE
jgi:hypothetical protein